MWCHCVPFGPFRFHSVNKQMPVWYWFFLLASAQYHSSLWKKYRCPVQYFAEKHYDESETLQSVHAWMSTRGWDLLQVQLNTLVWYFRKADDRSELICKPIPDGKYAIRKHVITEQKRGVKKYAIVFASTQLRITRLRKYPIDPKAYLERWWKFKISKILNFWNSNL